MNAKEYQFMREDFLKKTLKLSDDKRNYFKDGKEYSESIEGRIMDIINYLLLLVCMIRTYKQKGEVKNERKRSVI